MASERHTGGLFHVTVVPENFDPDEDSSGDDGRDYVSVT